MEYATKSDFPVHPLIRRRWSPRAFSVRPVQAQTLRSLLEAARWAPSSYNEQPWAYLLASREDPEEFARLLSVLMEGNRAWAQHAPVLMLSVAKLQFDRDGQPNRHALHDVGLATANLVTQATSLGLFAHQMAGFDAKKARELFAIPEAWEPVAVIALGYSDGVDTPPAPRSRKPLEDFVFAGRWGQPAPLVTPALEEA